MRTKAAYAMVLLFVVVLLIPGVRQQFFSQGYRWVYVLALSFGLTSASTPIVRALSYRFGALDEPEEGEGRKIHDRPTPVLGGIAVWIGIGGALAANSVWPSGLGAVLATATLLMLFSAVDDVRPIGSWTKFSVFLISAGLAVWAGAQAVIFAPGPIGTPINVVLSFLWIVGIFNSLNFLDGMDGLATGLAALIALFMGLVAFETNQPAIGWASAAIAGACLGFLPFNFRPGRRATIFLGDGGSNFLGFMLASIALLGYWADADPLVAISNPLLIFAVLIYDMTYITAARIASGKVRSFFEWIDYVGQDHLHHRILAILGNRTGTLVFILLLCACLGLAALALRAADPAGALLLLIQAVLILVLVTILERRGKKLSVG
jgi:UDP-GlcNAc:undecaprenyl-phosphate GlcNAc-1-phosphate transferase